MTSDLAQRDELGQREPSSRILEERTVVVGIEDWSSEVTEIRVLLAMAGPVLGKPTSRERQKL